MNKMVLLADSLEYIEAHLGDDDIKTEDIARECYCSKSALEKMFRCINNITIREYIIKRRMTKAAKMITEQPGTGILEIALLFGYSSNESFTRAFKEVWNCKPSEFRNHIRYSELFPKLTVPLVNGDYSMIKRRNVDISELYDLFNQRKNCCFIGCDIKTMQSINDISYKAGDLAILETLRRMNESAGEEDVVFRIGGDEFTILTNSEEREYAESIQEKIKSYNEKSFLYEGKEIPLSLHVGITKFEGRNVKYGELFAQLHKVVEGCKIG